jgi:hypothetical protein
MNNLKKLIKEIIKETFENSQKPDGIAHKEFARAIVNSINSSHQQSDSESVVGGTSVDLQQLETTIRTTDYFQVGTVEYNWDEIWKDVSDLLQEDYKQKLSLSSKLIENLKSKPSLGEKKKSNFDT